MQRLFRRSFAALGFGLLALALGMLVFLPIGCGPTPVAPPSGSGAKPFAGATLTIFVSDPALALEVRGRAKAWGNRNTASVTVIGGKPSVDFPEVDIAIVPQGGIAGPASRGELATVPESLTGMGKPFRWDMLFVPYQTSLVQWGRHVIAVPVAGDGLVCVYRADRFRDSNVQKAFRDQFQKELTAPRTWEDIAEIAAFFQRPGKPSLPPISSDRDDALALFHQLAACYDRAPTTSGNREGSTAARALSFHIELDGDRFSPRLQAPAFAAAYSWYNKTAPYRPATAGDPLAAIGTGTAVVAVLTLRELAQLPRDPKTGAVSDAFGIAPVPGTRTYFNADGQAQQAVGGRNAVPFFGGAGAFAIVYKKSANASAAWDFLGDLAGPEGSTSTITESVLGAGPLRESHVSAQTGVANWQRYGFDETRTRALASAMQAYTDSSVANPALPLRTPDAAEVYAIIETQLRRAAAGQATGAEAAAAAVAAWDSQDRTLNAEKLKMWRRNAAGLDSAFENQPVE